MKTRKVGTLTLGTCLIVFGILFILKIFIPTITYQFLFTLWPVIFVILGLEVICSYMFIKQENFVYDWVSFFLLIMLTGFAMIMSGVEFGLEHYDEFIKIVRY